MSSIPDKAANHGYTIARRMPGDVWLAKKEQFFFVLKSPAPPERTALQSWSKNAGPGFWQVEKDLWATEFLSGRNPFFWNSEDLPKLENMFRHMHSHQPESSEELVPLQTHITGILDTVASGPLATKAGASLQRAAEQNAPTQLIHGNLHPWNIFLRDRAHVISPRGIWGDPGFDIAFLAASLANDQEQFLEEMSSRLNTPSANAWFPGLVAYRLQVAEREIRQERVLRELAERVWG